MDTIDAAQEINRHRRRFLGAATMTVAAAQLGTFGSVAAQTTTKAARLPAIKPGTNTSFGSLKQIDAGVLNIAYAETGSADGAPVILLHGWPYDIHSFVGMTVAQARATGRPLLIGERPMTRVSRAIEKGETKGFMKVTVDAETHKILGASILGTGGDEAIHGILDMMNAGVSYVTLQHAAPIHPTVFRARSDGAERDAARGGE